MLTIRAAAVLLAQADSPLALHRIAHAIGFTNPPRPLLPDKLRALTIDSLVTNAWLSAGTGSLRLCTAILPQHDAHARTSDARELTRRLCTALARSAPLQRWCVLTVDANASAICIATVTQHPSGPRIAALRVDRHHVVDSDADTLRALATVTDNDDTLRHARFTDILRRDHLSARFYQSLEKTVDQHANSAAGSVHYPQPKEHAQHCATR